MNGREVVWHNGGTGGYRTWIGFDTDAKIAAIVLTNSAIGQRRSRIRVVAGPTAAPNEKGRIAPALVNWQLPTSSISLRASGRNHLDRAQPHVVIGLGRRRLHGFRFRRRHVHADDVDLVAGVRREVVLRLDDADRLRDPSRPCSARGRHLRSRPSAGSRSSCARPAGFFVSWAVATTDSARVAAAAIPKTRFIGTLHHRSNTRPPENIPAILGSTDCTDYTDPKCLAVTLLCKVNDARMGW